MNVTSAAKNAEKPIIFKAGSIIFAQGKMSKYLYLVKKGEVRLVKTKGAQVMAIKLCREREILNEVSVLTSKPLEFSGFARTDVELVLVDQKDIQSVISSSPEWIPNIFETLCERLISTQEMIEEHNLMAGENNPDLVMTKDEEKKFSQALAEFTS